MVWILYQGTGAGVFKLKVFLRNCIKNALDILVFMIDNKIQKFYY